MPPRQPSQDDLGIYGLLVEIKSDIGELTGTLKAHVQHDQEFQAHIVEWRDRLDAARTADATGALAAVKGSHEKSKDLILKVIGAVVVLAIGAAGSLLTHVLGWK